MTAAEYVLMGVSFVLTFGPIVWLNFTRHRRRKAYLARHPHITRGGKLPDFLEGEQL